MSTTGGNETELGDRGSTSSEESYTEDETEEETVAVEKNKSTWQVVDEQPKFPITSKPMVKIEPDNSADIRIIQPDRKTHHASSKFWKVFTGVCVTLTSTMFWTYVAIGLGAAIVLAFLRFNLFSVSLTSPKNQPADIQVDEKFDRSRLTPREVFHFPNLDYIGKGYDVRKGNPKTTVTGIDPGFRSSVYRVVYDDIVPRLTADKIYELPFGIEVLSCVSCALSFQSRVLTSSSDYQKIVKQDAHMTLTGSSAFGYNKNSLEEQTKNRAQEKASAHKKGIEHGSTTHSSTDASSDSSQGSGSAIFGLASGSDSSGHSESHSKYDQTVDPHVDMTTTTDSSSSGVGKRNQDAFGTMQQQGQQNSFSLNPDAKSVHGVIATSECSVVISEATCSVYDVSIMKWLPPSFSDEFILALLDLNNASESGFRYKWAYHEPEFVGQTKFRPGNNLFDKFIATFGTHVLVGATMGSKFGVMTSVSKEFVDKIDNDQKASVAQIASQVNAQKYMNNGNPLVGVETGENNTHTQFSTETKNEKVYSIGSRPSPTLSAASWASKSHENPMPINLKLRHILDIVIEFLPDSTFENLQLAYMGFFSCPISIDGYQCGGHGFCHLEKSSCQCDEGYYGDDCSWNFGHNGTVFTLQ